MNTIKIDKDGRIYACDPDTTGARRYFKPDDKIINEMIHNGLLWGVEQGKSYPVPENYEVMIETHSTYNGKDNHPIQYAILVPKQENNLGYFKQLTFKQLVQHGVDNGANIVNGMPWSWKINGKSVTHERDDLYLVECISGMKRVEEGDQIRAISSGLEYIPYRSFDSSPALVPKEKVNTDPQRTLGIKWCDSCGKKTTWVNGECENYTKQTTLKQFIEEKARTAWEDDQKTNPHSVNPYAYVYGYVAGAKSEAAKEYWYEQFKEHN